MSSELRDVPVACDPQALTAEVWAEHQATTAQLFGALREATEELDDGYAFRFPAASLALVAAFIERERRCCPFFTFHLIIPPAGAALTLRITGSPEAKGVLTTELLKPTLLP
ncbi:MAG TPA: hypothetical protein PKD53_19555 [Chloroflexaceae bacterium]|nr:hypothetical protein [Chloroflexaceae bacterium]